MRFRGQGECGAGFGWELGGGYFVCRRKLLLPLTGAEDAPSLDRYPMDARHIRCRRDALDFEKLRVAFRTGGVRDDMPVLVVVQIDEREHLAADGLVAYPEDEIRTPLHGLDDVRKGEEVGADAFGVHGSEHRSMLSFCMNQTPFSRKVLLIAAGLISVAVPVISGQKIASVSATSSQDAARAYTPTLTFDVASIRQSPVADSYVVGGFFSPHSSLLRLTNFDVRNLLSMAYGVRWDQIRGLPDWGVMFNIEARSDSAADERLAKLSKAQELLEDQHMLQVLLADRFKLKVHWETREGPTYNLVVAKNGPKLRETRNEPPSPEEVKGWGGQPVPRLYQQGDSNVGFDFIANGCSMEDIVGMLAEQFGRPVSDKTGLTGKYDFTLRYHGIRLSDRPADDLDPVPTLDTAIQDQLGLKLLPAKGPIQILVVDHIERPSEN